MTAGLGSCYNWGMSTNGPRTAKTDRRQRTRTVRGVTLHAEIRDWVTEDGQFRFSYDEHDRGWYVSRTDGEPQWWGAWSGAEMTPDMVHGHLAGSLAKGVEALQALGWLPSEDCSHRWCIRAEFGSLCGPHFVASAP